MNERGLSEAVLKDMLTAMSADDLRFLCDAFRLKRGGGKEELVLRLINSGYSAAEIMGPTAKLAIGILAEGFVPKSAWIEVLRANTFAASGSRHDLLLRLVENGLFRPAETLGALNPSQLREIYHGLFDRVPTGEPSSAIAEILHSFSIPEEEIESPRAEEPSQSEAANKELRNFEYDIALSFAGEQRPYVEKVAKIVQAAGVRVFYDEFEEVRMWGKDLGSFLEQLFRERARFCVLFLSADYARKAWPLWEGRAAIARLVQAKGEYILPVRFDNTDLPGLPPTTKYLDGRRLSPPEVAGNILQKLRLEGKTSDTGTSKNTIQSSPKELSSIGAEAERIAIDFIRGKKPNAKISVSSVRRQGPSRWTVEGDAFEKHERGGSSTHWSVEIDGIDVVSYDLKPGVGWFVS